MNEQIEEKELTKSYYSKVSSDEKSLKSKDYVENLKMIHQDSSSLIDKK